jgi:hypothetical protein
MAKPNADPKEEPRIFDANDHARALFSMAPPPLNDILPELCVSAGVQPWQLIIGHLMKADQRAELHAPLLMDEWTEVSPKVVPTRVKTCPSCNRELKRNPNQAFCCNYCGSGRYQHDQMHHPDCEFYVKPQRHLTIPGRKIVLPETPPEDPTERAAFEEEAFQQHLHEVESAETRADGLPPMPADPSVDVRSELIVKR